MLTTDKYPGPVFNRRMLDKLDAAARRRGLGSGHRHHARSFMHCKRTDAAGTVVARWSVGICTCGAQRTDGKWK